MVKVFKALGHEIRLQVVMALLQGKIHTCCGEIRSYEQGCFVTDLTDKFDMSQSTISHHQGILVDAEIAKMEKCGLWSVYLISTDAIQEIHETIGAWLTSCCGMPKPKEPPMQDNSPAKIPQFYSELHP